MADKLIEQIEADREAGTPGPWCVPDQTYRRNLTVDVNRDNLIPCPGSGGAMSYTEEVCTLGWNNTDHWLANARRIACVPDMEARILADAETLKAADEHLFKRLKALQVYFDLSDEELEALTPNERADTLRQHRLITEALAAYNAKRGERE